MLVADTFATIRLAKPALDLVEQVEPIQGVFNLRVVGQVFHGFEYPLFRVHVDSVLARTSRRGQRAKTSPAYGLKIPLVAGGRKARPYVSAPESCILVPASLTKSAPYR
jgi:hypothetical protein